MKISLLIFAVCVCVLVVFVYTSLRTIRISEALMAQAVPFSLLSQDYTKGVLVLGDSTAVGAGASSKEESVPGLFARDIGATYVENYAVSGAQVKDLHGQMTKAKRGHYTYILVQIGANDVTHFHAVDEIAAALEKQLGILPTHEKLVVLMAGNVGAASAFPWFIKPYYTKQTLRYHKAFAGVVSKVGGVYVNLYVDPKVDLFVSHPEIYLAKDGFHPSSAGYALWFEKIKEVALR